MIKEAELEFGKITVLIGPQSGGKSLLCKLAFFLEREVLEIATKSIVSNGYPFDGFLAFFKEPVCAAIYRVWGNRQTGNRRACFGEVLGFV